MKMIIAAIFALLAVGCQAAAPPQSAASSNAPPTVAVAASQTRPAARGAIPHNYAQWEREISAFEAADRASPPPRDGVLFIGSSTIRMWRTLAQDFPGYPVINRGFGGSEIADSTHFADRIVFPYAPKKIFFRAGTNDLHAGRSPEEVAADFAAFVSKVRERLPETDIYFLSLSPVPSRWGELDDSLKLNAMIKDICQKSPHVIYVDTWDITLTPDGKARPELFISDMLHLNAEGYKLLVAKVKPYLP